MEMQWQIIHTKVSLPSRIVRYQDNSQLTMDSTDPQVQHLAELTPIVAQWLQVWQREPWEEQLWRQRTTPDMAVMHSEKCRSHLLYRNILLQTQMEASQGIARTMLLQQVFIEKISSILVLQVGSHPYFTKMEDPSIARKRI
jgi:hypothetical protein